MILRSHVHACVVIVAVSSILCACSDDDPEPGGTTEESVPVVGAPPSSSPSSGAVRTDPQRLFGSARPLRSNLPAGLPSIDPSSYPSILDKPLSGPAIVAAAQIDEEAAATSFADQPVTFIDAEGQRRSLDPTDLGLGQDQWVGADGWGLGAPSPSGEMWAMVTREKVVTFALATGRVQTAELPDGGMPTAPQWFGPDQLVVGSNDRRRASYLVDVDTMALTSLDVPRFRVQVLDDGSILTFERTRGRAVIGKRSPDGTRSELAIPFDWKNPLVESSRVVYDRPE